MMPDWHETDAFWEDIYPVMFHDGRWEAARSEVDGILSLSLPFRNRTCSEDP